MDWKRNVSILQCGGLFNEKRACESDRSNIEQVRVIFEALRSRLVNDGYLDYENELDLLIIKNYDIEAFVLRVKDKSAICLSIGLIRAVWNLLILALCDPEIITNYPEDDQIDYTFSKKISRNRLRRPAVIASTGYDPKVHKQGKFKYQNITHARRELCESLFCLIIDYLLYHEAMHITRDHLSFFSIVSNELIFQENRFGIGSNYKILQMLELDADLTGLSYSLESHPEYKEIIELSASQKEDFFFWQIHFHLIIQQLFDLQNMDMDRQLIDNHPPPVFRSVLWSNLISQYFTSKKILSEAAIADQHDKAWYKASLVAIKLGFPLGRWHGDQMKDISFTIIDSYIMEFNEFNLMIDKDHSTNYNEEFRRFLKLKGYM